MALVSLLCTASFLLASGSIPDARDGHSLTLLADGTAVLYGGRDSSGSKKNDIYTLEVSSSDAIWTELNSSGDVPSVRLWHSLTVLSDGTAVLFGGFGGDLNDIYTLEVSSSGANWTKLNSSGDVPSARFLHSLTVLADGTAVLFGGVGGLNDIYTLEVSNSDATWTKLNSLGDVPSVRDSHSLTVLADGTAVLFGGEDSRWNKLSDIYTLELSNSDAIWTELFSSGDVPSFDSS